MKVEAMQEKLYEFEVGILNSITTTMMTIMSIRVLITMLNQVNKRNNLLFYGIKEDRRETPAELYNKVNTG